MHPKTVCLSKFAWPLNQPDIKRISIKNTKIQLGLYMSYNDETGSWYLFLALLLKLEREFTSLVFCGTTCHIFAPRFVVDSAI